MEISINIGMMNAKLWEVLYQLKDYSLMCNISEDELSTSLEMYLQHQSSLSHIHHDTVKSIGHNLFNQHTRFILNDLSNLNISQWILKMCQASRHLNEAMSQYVDIVGKRTWLCWMPKPYRFMTVTFWEKWLYASDIMNIWSKDTDQLIYYWALLQMRYATYEDLPGLYKCAMEAKVRLIKKQEEWYRRCYFWQYGVRQLLRQAPTYYSQFEQDTQQSLRKRFSPNHHAHDFGSLVIQEPKSLPLLRYIFSQSDIATMQMCWKIHYPVSDLFNIQKNEQDKVLIEYCLYGIHTGRHQAYRYEVIIATLLVYYPEPPGILSLVFKQTAINRIDFWLQFSKMAKARSQKYAQVINECLSSWFIEKEQLNQKPLNEIALFRVHPEDMVYFAGKFNCTLNIEQVDFVRKRLINLDYMCFSKMTWVVYQSVYTLWNAVGLIIGINHPITENYIQDLNQNFCLQQSLSHVLKQSIEAYMVVLAKYIWPRKLPYESLHPLLSTCQTMGGKIWQKGISNMLVDHHKQIESQRRDNGK